MLTSAYASQDPSVSNTPQNSRQGSQDSKFSQELCVHQSIDTGTALHFAAFKGLPEAIRLLVAMGADVNKGDKDDDAPIMRAIDADESRTVEVLVELGADVNTSNENGQTPLHRAVSENSPVITRFLLSKHADPNKRDVMGETPLFDAVEKEDISTEILDLLIGIPNQDLRMANRRGFNALHKAALKNNTRAVERLLSRDPGLATTLMEDKQYRAIHIAAINNHTEVLLMLLGAHSEVDPKSRNGQTPLHLACEEGFINSARILLDHGAEVNAQDSDLDTPLHSCLQTASQLLSQILGTKSGSNTESKLQLAQFLVQKGARTDMRNRKGKTPLDLAERDVKERLESFLRKGGNGQSPSLDVTSAGSRVPSNEEQEQNPSGWAAAKGSAHPSNADPTAGDVQPNPKAADPSRSNADASPENAEGRSVECKMQ